jgi:HSP20 family protein
MTFRRSPSAGRSRRLVTVGYQRLRYRYAVVVADQQPRPMGEGWRPVSPAAALAQLRWRPHADVAETDSSIAITVELAGVDPDEVEAVLYEDALIVSGRRELSGPGTAGVYHNAEISQGSFRLEIPLPAAIATDLSSARYERGLLELVLTKGRGADDGR